MSIKEKGKSAAKWSILEMLLKRGGAFIVSLFLTRLLSPSDFGMIAMCSVFLSVAESFSEMGIGQAIIQKKELNNIQYSSAFYLNLAIGLFIFSVMWVASPLIASFYGNQQLVAVLRVSSFSFVLRSFNTVNSSIMSKNLRFSIFTKASVFAVVISGIVGIGMAYMGFGIWSLVAQSLVSSLVNLIVIAFYSTWKPALVFSFSEVRDVWKKGLSFMNVGLINEFVDRLDNLVIGKYFSASDLGFMNRAKALQELPQYALILPVTRPLFPVFANLQDNTARVKDVFIKSVELMTFGVVLIFGLFFLSSENIVVIMYSDKWIESAPYLKLILWFLPILPMGTIITSLLKGVGDMKLLTRITIMERSIIIIALFFCLSFGLMVYLYILVGLKYLVFLIRMFLVHKYHKMPFLEPLKTIVGLLVMAIALIGSLMFLDIDNRFLDVLVKSLLFAVGYLAFCRFFKVHGYFLAKAELMELIAKYKVGNLWK